MLGTAFAYIKLELYAHYKEVGMKAMQAMTRNVVCIHPTDSLESAKDVMGEWEIRHLPVIEGGKLVGILSDRDILLHTTVGVSGDQVVTDIEVGEVMTHDVVTCYPSDSIAKIATIMTERKIDSLPVVESDGELVGLVTSTDLLELLKEKDVLDSGRLIPWSYHLRFRDLGDYGSRYME